jgi:hypothetical protein
MLSITFQVGAKQMSYNNYLDLIKKTRNRRFDSPATTAAKIE